MSRNITEGRSLREFSRELAARAFSKRSGQVGTLPRFGHDLGALPSGVKPVSTGGYRRGEDLGGAHVRNRDIPNVMQSQARKFAAYAKGGVEGFRRAKEAEGPETAWRDPQYDPATTDVTPERKREMEKNPDLNPAGYRRVGSWRSSRPVAKEGPGLSGGNIKRLTAPVGAYARAAKSGYKENKIKMTSFKQYLKEFSPDDSRRLKIRQQNPSEKQRLSSIQHEPGAKTARRRNLKALGEVRYKLPADIKKRQEESEARITPEMRRGRGTSGVEKEYTGKDEPKNETPEEKRQRIMRHRGGSWKGGY